MAGSRLLSPLAMAGAVLDLVLPPRCLSCGALVAQQGSLCGTCWPRMNFLGPPCCAICGEPFESNLGPAALCGRCAGEAPSYERARAALAYDEHSRPLILRFKHADRTDGAQAFATWMLRAGAELVADCDVISPVPLHRWRLLRRRYNQAALLAQAVARQSGKPCVPDLLARRTATASQGHLSAAQRRRNVRGAFTLKHGWAELVKGKRVLLIDDVMTSGATAESASRALLSGGAAAIDVLTLARVSLSH